MSWIVIGVVLVMVFNQLSGTPTHNTGTVDYSKFINEVQSGNVSRVVMEGRTLRGVLTRQWICGWFLTF